MELLLRERDSERLTDYVWPYGGGGSHAIYRNSVDQAHISEVNLLLNEIPAGGKVDILVSPIRALSIRQGELANPSLEVAGTKVTLPVSLKSGQYIELESADDCVLYDERGELLSRFRPQAASLPRLAEGANSLRFDCTPPQGLSARAEVTVVSLGQPFGSRRAETEIDWSRLDREYEVPRIVTRTDGVDNLWTIVRRAEGPGGRQEAPPMLELEISVQQLAKPEKASQAAASALCLDRPILTIGPKVGAVPRGLLRDSGSSAADQATWRDVGPDGAEAASASWPASSQRSHRDEPGMLDFGGRTPRVPRDRQDRETLSLTSAVKGSRGGAERGKAGGRRARTTIESTEHSRMLSRRLVGEGYCRGRAKSVKISRPPFETSPILLRDFALR